MCVMHTLPLSKVDVNIAYKLIEFRLNTICLYIILIVYLIFTYGYYTSDCITYTFTHFRR